MQKSTVPFIHPIRKHMKDLIELQSQDVAMFPCEDSQIEAGMTVAVNPKPQVTLSFLIEVSSFNSSLF